MKNYTRRLLFSMVTMIVCIAMLVGSTFAWFTDVAKSTNNVINPGRLDLEVEYTLDGENWEDLDGAENIFGDGLFEPGYTRVVAFKVRNNGSLAFKYKMSGRKRSRRKFRPLRLPRCFDSTRSGMDGRQPDRSDVSPSCVRRRSPQLHRMDGF